MHFFHTESIKKEKFSFRNLLKKMFCKLYRGTKRLTENLMLTRRLSRTCMIVTEFNPRLIKGGVATPLAVFFFPGRSKTLKKVTKGI